MDNSSNVMDPALLQQLVSLGAVPDQQGLARQKMQYGREDSQAQMPQGYHVGGTYQAASPLEHLAAALQRGVGLAQQRGAMGEQAGLIGQQTAGRNAYAEALQRLLGGQQDQALPQAPMAGTIGEGF